MKIRKLVAMGLAAVMMMSMTACGGNDNGGSSTSTGDSESGDGKTYNIGICQLVQHDALDAATKGFKDALTENSAIRLPLMSRTHREIPRHVRRSSTRSFRAAQT